MQLVLVLCDRWLVFTYTHIHVQQRCLRRYSSAERGAKHTQNSTARSRVSQLRALYRRSSTVVGLAISLLSVICSIVVICRLCDRDMKRKASSIIICILMYTRKHTMHGEGWTGSVECCGAAELRCTCLIKHIERYTYMCIHTTYYTYCCICMHTRTHTLNQTMICRRGLGGLRGVLRSGGAEVHLRDSGAAHVPALRPAAAPSHLLRRGLAAVRR
jgi:hypothetical protein